LQGFHQKARRFEGNRERVQRPNQLRTSHFLNFQKTPIIEEIILLTGIITNSAFTCPLTDSDADTRTVWTLIRLFSNLWSWASSNALIEIAFLKCLSVISRDCVTVCKCLALKHQGVPHPILKLIITTLVVDTFKAKSPKMNFDSLKLGFAILTNCCACIEGRLLIGNMNVLDVIDRLHPAETKLQSPWDTSTFLWLSFWERFSRYPEGAGVR
jgi:rotatin